ncbi:MAG: ferrochelatase [Planctomycetes bacterium]|nr:ferrochelatase [Planctomycetota bacterium]
MSAPGLLLVNTGTPASPAVADVRRYLAEFLMDGRMLAMPFVARWLLVHGVILRTRPRRSAHAYAQIWTERGSPLLRHAEDLAAGLCAELGAAVAGVRVGMRYGHPSVARALGAFSRQGVDELVVVPLFPQYSAAAWASAFDAVAAAAARLPVVPALRFVPPFHAEPGFLDAAAAVARPHLAAAHAERVLFSFHSLPESHVRAQDRSGGCLLGDCCASLGPGNATCYRAQCFATARALAARLQLAPGTWEVAFQSRFTKHWVRPFTDQRLVDLARSGVTRVAVLSPAFVADCLETLEELARRGAETFRAAGGRQLVVVPCVNAAPEWVAGLAGIVRRHLRAG